MARTDTCLRPPITSAFPSPRARAISAGRKSLPAIRGRARDKVKSNCYSAADYLRDKIASPGQASEYDWDNIAQSVGGLADQILAKLC